MKRRASIGRPSVTIYRWIRDQGYLPDDTVLGHTCKMAIGFYGRCPYELEREQARTSGRPPLGSCHGIATTDKLRGLPTVRDVSLTILSRSRLCRATYQHVHFLH